MKIGLHWDVEVTDGTTAPCPAVSQAFCSALPVAYSRANFANGGEAFASLVLEAAYEATLLAGALNAARGRSNRVLLTLLGGGAFGNERPSILAAMGRALRLDAAGGLDVHIVSHGAPPADLTALSRSFT